MTRKDYVAIARAIKNIRESLTVAHVSTGNREVALSAVDSTAYALASVLQQDNERFDRDRFLLASNFGGTGLTQSAPTAQERERFEARKASSIR